MPDITINSGIFKKIETLELSLHTVGYLRNENMKYVGDLVQKTEAEILCIPGLRRDALDEIKEALAQLGLHLNMDVPGWPPDNVEELAKRFVDY